MTNRQKRLFEKLAEKIESGVRAAAAEHANRDPEQVALSWCDDGDVVASTDSEDIGYRWTVSSDGTVQVEPA